MLWKDDWGHLVDELEVGGQFLAQAGEQPENYDMTVSQLRIAKSETRDMADRDRMHLTDVPAWNMNNATFFAVFVAIAAGLTIVALIAR